MSKIYVNTVSPLSGNAVTASHGVMLSGVASGTLAGPSSYLGIDTDGLMVLSDANHPADLPGGSDTEIQYNDGGAFGGVTSLTYADGTGHLNVVDDKKLHFGTGNESYIEYRETSDNYLHISGSSKGIVLSGSAIVISGALQPGRDLLTTHNIQISGGLVCSTQPDALMNYNDPVFAVQGMDYVEITNSPVAIQDGSLTVMSGNTEMMLFDREGEFSLGGQAGVQLSLSGASPVPGAAGVQIACNGETLFSVINGELNLSGSDGIQIAGGLRFTTASIAVKAAVDSGSIAGPGSYLGLTETGQVVLTASSGGGGGGVTNPLGVDVPLYFDDAATDFYIQKTDTGFSNGLLEIVSKGYGGFAALGGMIALSSSYAVVINTGILSLTAEAVEYGGAPPYSIMSMYSAPSGSEGDGAVPLVLAMSGGARNDPGTYSGVNLVSANSISLYSGFESPFTGTPNPGEGWLEISASAGTWMSGSSLRLDPITVASGTAAGPGSLLSVTEDGQVVLTSSAGGGGGVTNPLGAGVPLYFDDAAADFYIQKANGFVDNGSLEIVSKGYGGALSLGGVIALSSSFAVTISTPLFTLDTVGSGTAAGPGSLLSVTEDGQVVLTASSGGGGGGAVTALNNAVQSRLVTIGSTTTELDGEADMTYDGTTFLVSGSTLVLTGSGRDNANRRGSPLRAATSTDSHALFVSGTYSSGVQAVVGINNPSPNPVALDVMYTFGRQYPELEMIYAGQRGGGHRLKFDANYDKYNQVEGTLYFLSASRGSADGAWVTASAASPDNGFSSGSYQLLALGMGGMSQDTTATARDGSGVLLEGYMNVPAAQFVNVPNDHVYGVAGLPIYVATTSGKLGFQAPTGSGEFVRVVGYGLSHDYKGGEIFIRFNPDSTWVDIA